MDCQDLNLLGALHVWLQGKKLDDMCVYGLSSVWWNRGAKVLAFFAGLTVLIEIVGETRVREMAAGLRARLNLFRVFLRRSKRAILTRRPGYGPVRFIGDAAFFMTCVFISYMIVTKIVMEFEFIKGYGEDDRNIIIASLFAVIAVVSVLIADAISESIILAFDVAAWIAHYFNDPMVCTKIRILALSIFFAACSVDLLTS